jgi:hypothetical protein
MTDPDLVCGIDVGSQGSCLAVFDPGGERLATSYQPHTLSYRGRDGPSRTRATGGRRS